MHVRKGPTLEDFTSLSMDADTVSYGRSTVIEHLLSMAKAADTLMNIADFTNGALQAITDASARRVQALNLPTREEVIAALLADSADVTDGCMACQRSTLGNACAFAHLLREAAIEVKAYVNEQGTQLQSLFGPEKCRDLIMLVDSACDLAARTERVARHPSFCIRYDREAAAQIARYAIEFCKTMEAEQSRLIATRSATLSPLARRVWLVLAHQSFSACALAKKFRVSVGQIHNAIRLIRDRIGDFAILSSRRHGYRRFDRVDH